MQDQSSPPVLTDKVGKKTYFGITAFIVGIFSVLSLLSNFAVANLNISAELFSKLNNFTALFFCILTPLTFGLGVAGYTRKNDSKNFSRVALALALIPFLFMFVQFVYSFIR